MPRSPSRAITLFTVARTAGFVTLVQAPPGTAFTYQGQPTDGGAHALRFVRFDQMTGGVPQGVAVYSDDVAVAEALFAVELDFGAQFAGREGLLARGGHAQRRQDSRVSRSEAAKLRRERGKLQHPKLHGQPAEMRVDYDAAQKHGSREHASMSEVCDGARE